MGYYTWFNIDIEPDPPTQIYTDLDNLGQLDEVNEYAINGHSKWYDWEKDLRAISLKYPGHMFYVEGKGEETDDFWKARIINGQSEIVYGYIKYKEFQEIKIKEEIESRCINDTITLNVNGVNITNQELAKTEQGQGSMALQSINKMMDAAQFLIDNNLIPKARTTPKAAEVVMIIATGQSLGMDPITSVNSIDLIQGRVSVQSRIIPGLLSRKGIAVNLIQDYEPVYGDPIPMRDDEGKPVINEDGVVKYYKDPDGNYIRKEVDRVTTLEFVRDFGGDIGVVRNKISFYWSDAVKAGWIQKDNWSKLP